MDSSSNARFVGELKYFTNIPKFSPYQTSKFVCFGFEYNFYGSMRTQHMTTMW